MGDMLVRLYNLPDGTEHMRRLAAQGITVRRAMPYEKHLVLDWVEQQFSRRWASECDVAFSNQPISCFVATQAGAIVGFACYDATCKGFFGPTGVLEALRGRGIGQGLLLATLEAMWALGYGYAAIGWIGPKEFYARTVGAIEIPDSTPGIYRDMLHEPDRER